MRRWAVVLGGADCVWEDLRRWEEIYGQQWDGLVIAANDIGCVWPRPLDHWVSLHPTKFEKWKELRAAAGHPAADVTWGRMGHFVGKVTWQPIHHWPGGDSGLLGVQVAQLLGVNRVILCGVPMTSTAHFTETVERHGPVWWAAAGHITAWARHRDHLLGWVRSMSGRTAEMLGQPTVEWLRVDVPFSKG